MVALIKIAGQLLADAARFAILLFRPTQPVQAGNLSPLPDISSGFGSALQQLRCARRVLACPPRSGERDDSRFTTADSLYRAQGRYGEAEPLYKRSLVISEKARGPDHPSVGTALSNLGLLYQTQGRYAEAEPLPARSREISKRVRGSILTIPVASRNSDEFRAIAAGSSRSIRDVARRFWGNTETTWRRIGPEREYSCETQPRFRQ